MTLHTHVYPLYLPSAVSAEWVAKIEEGPLSLEQQASMPCPNDPKVPAFLIN